MTHSLHARALLALDEHPRQSVQELARVLAVHDDTVRRLMCEMRTREGTVRPAGVRDTGAVEWEIAR